MILLYEERLERLKQRPIKSFEDNLSIKRRSVKQSMENNLVFTLQSQWIEIDNRILYLDLEQFKIEK